MLDIDGVLKSASGVANVDLNIGNVTDFTNAYYKGDIALEDFNLGKITDSKSLGTITADLKFDGRGFKPETINTQINGAISSFFFQGYIYSKNARGLCTGRLPRRQSKKPRMEW